jgi:hypothetical protein
MLSGKPIQPIFRGLPSEAGEYLVLISEFDVTGYYPGIRCH